MEVSKERMFWLDKIAESITRGWKPSPDGVFRVECGIGASGIPHVGSVADALRSYGVKLALEDRGLKSELIVYADDMDGLRKVPMGLPSSLQRYLGFPVSDIPDPFNCHDSFAEHIESLFLDALDRLDMAYRFVSGYKAYKSGILNDYIRKILLNASEIRRIDIKMTGAKREEGWIYYWPICENCGRIYTTFAYRYLPREDVILYRCASQFKGVEGCGHEGEVRLSSGCGKVAWKAEMAIRWARFHVVFEARGKDIDASFQVNMAVASRILGIKPPHSIVYELFLGKTGRKISKSTGNVFTPQTWFRYGTPESLRLLMFKRYQGTRKLDVEDVPIYMDELDRLEDLYFNLSRIKNLRERIRVKRLYEYVRLLKPPERPLPHIPYMTGVELVSSIPVNLDDSNKLDLFLFLLRKQGILKEIGERERLEIKRRLRLYINWYEDFVKPAPEPIKPSEKEVEAIYSLVSRITDNSTPDDVQEAVFEVAREFGIPPRSFFRLLYLLIIGRERGPKISTYVRVLGPNKFKQLLLVPLRPSFRLDQS